MSALAVVLLALGCGPEPTPAAPGEPEPPRIVSVGRELGEVLVELGLGPAVVGTDSASRALPALRHAADLGSADAASVESARALRPDLVLVLAQPTDPRAALARRLRELGVSAELLTPRRANDVMDTIHEIGLLTGRVRAAAAVSAKLAQAVAEVATLRDGRSRLTAAWVLARDPLLVVGSDGFLHELLELAGAENAFHSPGAERLEVTPAELAARAPDVVVSSLPGVPTVPGARNVTVAPSLSAIPLLDVAARVRALHVALYPPTPE